jgi:hypothetical protein
MNEISDLTLEQRKRCNNCAQLHALLRQAAIWVLQWQHDVTINVNGVKYVIIADQITEFIQEKGTAP